MEGLGERSVSATLSRLLQITDEAVIVFDGVGCVLLANDQAARLFSKSGSSLVDLQIDELFAPGESSDPDEAFSVADLPFPVDGSPKAVVVTSADGSPVLVKLRCDQVPAVGETYLLVAHPAEADERLVREDERELAELRRANHRLSGALGIVLDTLDSRDVGTLFSNVINEITETMDADATVLYLAEAGGFRLRGYSESLQNAKLPRFITPNRSLKTFAVRSRRSMCLRVLPPRSETLRQGKLRMREVVDEETKEVLHMRQSVLPPFTSFIVVPVWFDNNVIAIIEVGWTRMRAINRDDAKLLDAVAHYLSVQLAGAFSAMRTQRVERLNQLSSELREELLDSATEGEQLPEKYSDVLARVAAELNAEVVPLEENVHQRVLVAKLPNAGPRAIPFDLDELSPSLSDSEVAVITVNEGSKLYNFLRKMGEPCVGALLDLGVIGGVRRAFLLLRPEGSEPFDDTEISFLHRLADDVHDISQGEEVREQDKRISQALQQGLQNVLQKVDGITAHAIYSSATAAAFVGGDFYDLIRLPKGRACVIMGDVSGKGVEAASVSAAVKTALGAYSWEGLAPAHMVRSLNDFLLGFSRIETFATLFVGIVDLPSATLTYCSAGHPPSILWRRETGEVSLLDVQSGVVGAFHDMTYTDGVVRLSEGDVLFLYTDGTTEARSPSGAFFGEDGLRDMVMDEMGGDFDTLLERFLARLDEFTGRKLDDDVAMVALRFDALGDDEGTVTKEEG